MSIEQKRIRNLELEVERLKAENERLRRRSVMPADIGGSARNTEAEEKPAWRQ